MPSPSKLTGRKILHYQILEKIGEGGMGVVFRAEDTKLRRTVALKFLPPTLLAAEDDRHRFVQEARAYASFSHPNIATVYEIGESGGETFIALEYIEGETIAARVKAGPVKLEDAVNIAVQISEGLQAAHEKGIVHRDIKTQNVMVTSRGLVKILDFGLAKLRGASALTRVGTTLGTMGYMSPEQLRGEGVDHRTDLWALGVVLYEMIAGRAPFRGDYDEAIAYQVVNQEPEPLSAIRADVPTELERIVNTLLSKNVAGRYQRTEDLLADLRSVSTNLSPAAEKGTRPPVRTSRWKPVYRFGAFLFLVLIGVGVYLSRPGASKPIESLAVLPLENLSRDVAQEYFADGMTEALTVELANIRALKVISRTSTLTYKANKKPMQEIARELDVDGVIEGSVQHSEGRVGITVQLIDARNDRSLWGRSYERDLGEILSMQREVARDIAGEIRIALTPGEEARLAKTAVVLPEAYQLYLKGRYFWDKRTPGDMRTAIDFFRRAIDLDPGYALAYAGLADCYLFQAPVPRSEAIPAARGAALRALAIDSTLSEAHTTLGFVKMNFEWDWEGAERELLRAIECNPNYAVARQFYGAYLVLRGTPERGIEQVRRALELDPLSLALNWHLGLMLYFARRTDESIDQYRKTLQLDPSYALAIGGLGDAYVQKKSYGAAVREYERLPAGRTRLAYAHASSGRSEEARRLLANILALPGQDGASPYELARVYAALGDRDEAMKLLAEGYRQRTFNMFFLKVDPAFDTLRSDPRFSALLSDLRLGD